MTTVFQSFAERYVSLTLSWVHAMVMVTEAMMKVIIMIMDMINVQNGFTCISNVTINFVLSHRELFDRFQD